MRLSPDQIDKQMRVDEARLSMRIHDALNDQVRFEEVMSNLGDDEWGQMFSMLRQFGNGEIGHRDFYDGLMNVIKEELDK